MAEKIKFRNMVRLVGVLVDYDLVEENRQNQQGEPYTVIRGKYVIDTGNDNTHEINAFYMATFPSGKPNGNYTVMKRILDADAASDTGEKTGIGMRIQLSASFEENSFVNNGELIKTHRVGGGFLETNPSRMGADKAEFSVDMLLEKDPIPEIRDEEETGRYIMEGSVGNYRGELYPVRFVLEIPEAVQFFNDLEKPCVIAVWGDVVNRTVINRIEEPNAFGAPRIVEQTRTTRENVIGGSSVEPREMSEALVETIKEGKQAYNVLLAQKEADAKTAGGRAFTAGSGSQPTTTTTAPKAGGFNF